MNRIAKVLCEANKRKRKNSDQINILIDIFNKHPRWDKSTVDRASRLSGLSRSQVYKWGWDRKKKDPQSNLGIYKPTKDEFGGYSKHEFVQNDHKSIANLLQIDLNQEVQKLLVDFDSPKHEIGHGSGYKGRSGTKAGVKRHSKTELKQSE